MKHGIGQLIFLLLALASAVTGVLWTLIPDINDIKFFTLEGNTVCAVLLFIDLLYFLSGSRISRRMGIWEYVFLVAILTIGIAYCTLLTDFFSKKFWTNYNTVLLHFVTPLLYSIYVLKYRRAALPQVKAAGWAMIPPFLYGGFILIRHYVFVEALGMVPRWFPYFFMDLDKLGLDGFIKWVVGMSIVIYLMGVLILFLVNLNRRRY